MNEQVNLEKYCNETKSWLNDIANVMRVPDRTDWAMNVMKAVLHTIRDRTTLQEVFHLSAQLPVLVRGIYLEGYKPTGKPIKMNAEEFMQQIKKRMAPSIDIPVTEAVRAVITVLYERTSPGEMDDIKGLMPKDIQKLWNSVMPAAEEEL
ncbi:MAG: DUF2267 domain-containing protein [Balneolaceae bacterium]|nr:MAG: DUF2267 domain-containing protein [Balneolaceae bacterium]